MLLAALLDLLKIFTQDSPSADLHDEQVVETDEDDVSASESEGDDDLSVSSSSVVTAEAPSSSPVRF